jgi:hypothetical protein
MSIFEPIREPDKTALRIDPISKLHNRMRIRESPICAKVFAIAQSIQKGIHKPTSINRHSTATSAESVAIILIESATEIAFLL